MLLLLGSGTRCRPSKYVIRPGVFVTLTFPMSLGNAPTKSGKLFVLGRTWNGFGVVLLVVRFRGIPEFQLTIEPNCQRSTSRDSHPGALLSNIWFGPNGSFHVPLLRIACVRWKVCRVFVDRFRGSTILVPIDRLHTYVVWFVKPCDNRLVTANCME